MKLYILGTASAFPTKKRNHPGIFMKYLDKGILFDAGENIQRQMRIAGLSPTDIDIILITHWHGDHMLGLPGILFSLSNMEYKRELNIILPRENFEDFYKLMDGLNIPIEFNINLIEAKNGLIYEDDKFEIYGIETRHSVKSFSYYFKEKEYIKIDKEKLRYYNLSVNQIKKIKKGEKIFYNGKEIDFNDIGYIRKGIKISYITDTIFFEDLIKFAENSTILICESTFFFDPEKAKEHYHMDFTEVLKLYLESKSKILLLTHFSQRYEEELDKIKKDIEEKYDDVYILNDFDRIEIEKNIISLYLSNKLVKYKFDEKTGYVLRI
ncbi:MAG: ribonuclease Z [Nanopusillaceae archaeon]